MNRIIVISAVCMQFGWISGVPYGNNDGVGAYAYQDSTGNRYSGTFGLNDDKPHLGNQGHQAFQAHFNPLPFGPDFDDFFPEYFKNFEHLLQEAFNSNLEYQKKAIQSARKAYDITSNQAGFMPNFDFSRLPGMGSVPGMGGGFGSGFGSNAAFASAQAAPGFTHQTALLSPANPNVPNVDITHRFGESPAGGGYMGVSSSSFASSSNINGKEESHRIAETVVNNNGKVTHYKVQD